MLSRVLDILNRRCAAPVAIPVDRVLYLFTSKRNFQQELQTRGDTRGQAVLVSVDVRDVVEVWFVELVLKGEVGERGQGVTPS